MYIGKSIDSTQMNVERNYGKISILVFLQMIISLNKAVCSIKKQGTEETDVAKKKKKSKSFPFYLFPVEIGIKQFVGCLKYQLVII